MTTGNEPQLGGQNSLIKTVTYVKLYHVGSFVDDTSIREIESRNTSGFTIPDGVFAFQFFDVLKADANGIALESKPQNYSPLYYYQASVMMLDDVKQELPDEKILISNMEGNRWDKVIRCRYGNFKPYTDNAVLLDG